MSNYLHFAIFALVFFSVTGGVHYYLWLRMVRDTGLVSPWREIATVVLVILFVSLPLVFILGRALPFDIFRIVSFAPYTWLGAMMLFFFAFLSIDLVKAVFFVAKKIAGSGTAAPDLGRRMALGQIIAGTTVLTVAGAATAGVVQAVRKAVVTRVSISLRGFPETLNGLKIVQISDLHIGITVGRRWLEEVVERVNALQPDLIAITGDLIDGLVERLRQEIEPLGDLKAKLGAYFVTGNHEYYSGVDRWIAEVEGLGIRVLRNEAISVGEGEEIFYLAGVDDYSAAGMAPGHGQNIPRAVKDVPKDKSVVLLAHQPKAVHEAAEHGIDLVLSGHTHGGQIFPFSLLVALQQTYNKGLHRHSDTTQIYVNQGTFMWGPPMRLGTECEITELILKRG